MQTLFRILIILCVASVLAAGMYLAVQNQAVRNMLGVPAANVQLRAGGSETATGSTIQMTRSTFEPNTALDAAQGARGEHEGGTNIVRNLTLMGGMIFGVMIVQQIAARVSRRRQMKPVR